MKARPVILSGGAGVRLWPISRKNLAKQLIQSVVDINEKMSAENKTSVVVTSPLIRKDISILLRQHIEDVIVLAFTELPENKKVKVISTIGEKINNNSQKEKTNENTTV